MGPASHPPALASPKEPKHESLRFPQKKNQKIEWPAVPDEAVQADLIGLAATNSKMFLGYALMPTFTNQPGQLWLAVQVAACYGREGVSGESLSLSLSPFLSSSLPLALFVWFFLIFVFSLSLPLCGLSISLCRALSLSLSLAGPEIAASVTSQPTQVVRGSQVEVLGLPEPQH